MSDIVYQDDYARIIYINNADDIRNYTDSELGDKVVKYYEHHEDGGDFYIIHTNRLGDVGREKQYYIFQGEDVYYFNQDFKETSASDFKRNLRENEMFSVLKYINENISYNSTSIYSALLDLSSGKSINGYYLKLYNDNISDVKISEKNPKKSIFVLTFSDDEYLEILNLDDEEQYFINSVYSYYGNNWSEMSDLDSEWVEGYILQDFDDENLQKVKTLLTNNGRVDLIDKMPDSDSEISKLLDDLYPDEVSRILSEYGDNMNEHSDVKAKKDIEKYYCNPLFRYGLLMSSCMYKYMISVSKLKSIYDEVGISDLSIVEVLKEYFDNRNIDFNENLSVDSYVYQTIEPISFNSSISSILDKMIEESENEMDESSQKIKELIIKYGLRKSVKTPKGAFRIERYDLENGTVDYRFTPGSTDVTWESPTRRATYDDFMVFLNNYELFENKIIKLLRQLNEQDSSNKEEQLVIDFLETLPQIKPNTNIEFLKKEIEDYNGKKGKNLNLNTVLKFSNEPKSNFPFKIDLFGVPMGDKQKIISTLSYKINPNTTFTFTNNPVWGKKLIGVNRTLK